MYERAPLGPNFSPLNKRPTNQIVWLFMYVVNTNEVS